LSSIRFVLPLLLLPLLAATIQAQQGRLLVTQKGLQSLAIVDPVAGKVIASVPEGGITGHEVIASSDGRLAFVPIYSNVGVGQPGTNGANLVVIDIAAQKVVGNIDFGHGVRPHCPLIGPKDGLLYVTTEIDQSITLIDPKTLKIVGSIPTGQPQSHMLVLSNDGRRGYTANVGPGTVSVLDILPTPSASPSPTTTIGSSQPTRPSPALSSSMQPRIRSANPFSLKAWPTEPPPPLMADGSWSPSLTRTR
jgi:DNA-binding beta-propeller fold protein YncE